MSWMPRSSHADLVSCCRLPVLSSEYWTCSQQSVLGLSSEYRRLATGYCRTGHAASGEYWGQRSVFIAWSSEQGTCGQWRALRAAEKGASVEA
jgi:hypothetical protein